MLALLCGRLQRSLTGSMRRAVQNLTGAGKRPFNHYAYNRNDPTNEIDPSGSSPWDFANGVLDYSTFGLTDFAGKANTDHSGRSYQTGVGIGFVAGLFYGGTEWHIAGALAKIGSRLAINGVRFEANELVSASRFACPHVGEPQGTPLGARLIYRTGSTTDNSLTDTAGVSFRSSISSSAEKVQVFKPGEKIYAVDTGLLPPGSVTCDNIPFGHVSVFASPDQIRSSIIPQGAGNPLFDAGINRLQGGFSYRIPK